jgi:hypothetical protein
MGFGGFSGARERVKLQTNFTATPVRRHGSTDELATGPATMAYG